MSKYLKLEDLTKSNVWTVTESELCHMLLEGKKKEGYADNETHYMNIIHSVFDIQYFDRDDEKKKQQLENEQYDLFYAPNDGENNAIAIKKRRIKKITDLTLENVSHLTPEDILTLIENNMGTGWKGLPLAIQDIIESAFYVDVSLLPEAAMHRKGGIIDRKKADGYEVLELERGNWIEAIFVKQKPKLEKLKFSYLGNTYKDEDTDDNEDDDDDDDSLDNEMDDVTPNEDEVEEDVAEDQEPHIEDIDVIDETEDGFHVHQSGEAAADAGQEPAEEEPKKAIRAPVKRKTSKKDKVLTEEQENYRAILSEISGTKNSVLIDAEGNILDKVEVKNLANYLKDSSAENITTIVFDGVISQNILDISSGKGIKTLVGKNKGKIAKLPAEITIWTRTDLL